PLRGAVGDRRQPLGVRRRAADGRRCKLTSARRGAAGLRIERCWQLDHPARGEENRTMRARAGLILLVAALSMGGCALTEDTVKLSYQPRGPAQRLDEAQEVTVVVVVRDERRSN